MTEVVWVEAEGIGLIRIARSDIVSVTRLPVLRKVVVKMRDGTSLSIREQSARSIRLIE
jgi:hypothetical protein